MFQTGYTTNFTMPGIIVLKNHRQTMLWRGVCVSKDVIIKEILSNESTIDSTVLHHDEWWPDDLQFRYIDIHDFDLVDVPESSNQRTIDIVNYGLFLSPNKDALPCIRSWLKANTRYTSKVTWWTSSRTRRGSIHRRETSLTVNARETRDNFVRDLAGTPYIGR